MGREERRPLPFAAAGIPIIGQGQPRNPMTKPPQVRDLLNRVIHEGDFVTLHTQHPQLFRITRIEPLIEEGVPAGLMKITSESVAIFASDRDMANREFLLIKEAEVRQEQPTDGDDQVSEPASTEPGA